MKRKFLGRVSAVAMASAMMVSMFGMTTFAADGLEGDGNTPITEVTVNKTVTTDGDTYAPNTTFGFDVNTAGETTYEGATVKAGVDGGLVFSEGAVFTPNMTTVSGTYTANGSLDVNSTVFTEPGIYHYQVSEKQGSYDGIDYDDAVYDVYVYVYNRSTTGTTNSLYVGNIVSVDSKGSKTDLAFTNDYGKDNNTTHDVTITKNITGTMADLRDKFTFTVKVTGADGEQYKVETTGSTTNENVYLTSGKSETFTLGNGDTIHIYGLSENDTYEVTEDAANQNGYTTTINKDKTDDGKISGMLTTDGTQITYENNKAGEIATGIIMNIAPYIVLVAFAAVAALFFLRRRNNREF